MKAKLTVASMFTLVLCLMLSSVVMGQVKKTQVVVWLDGDQILEHTFAESMYVPGRVMLVPYNGVVRYDDVKVTGLDGQVLFSDDFESETLGAFPSRWERANAAEWTIVDENGNKVLEQSSATATGMSDIWPKAPHFTSSAEHVFEFKYKLVSWNGSTYRMNFIFRGEDRNNNYMIQYNNRDQVLAIAHRASGGDNRIVSIPFELETDRWYSFRVEVKMVD